MNLRSIALSAAILTVTAFASCGPEPEAPVELVLPTTSADTTTTSATTASTSDTTTTAVKTTDAASTSASSSGSTSASSTTASSTAASAEEEPKQEEQPQEQEEHNDEPAAEPETEAPTEAPAASVSFSADDLLSDTAALTAKLGAPEEKYKAAACTKNGSDITVYKYSGLEIQSYTDDGGKDSVCSIMITSDKYPTAEGLKVGDPQSNADSCYGSGKTEGDKIYYTLDSKELEIGISGGSVSYINFYYPV